MRLSLRDKNCWFYLEPYVHTSIKHNNVLLYNTLNGAEIEYNGQSDIIRIVKRIKSKKNIMVIKLFEKDLFNSTIFEFINNVRKCFMGDLLDIAYSKGKPIQLIPMLNIQKDPQKLKKEPDLSVGDNVMKYLTQVSLYINNQCDQKCSLCHGAYKQFLYCNKNEKSQHELNILEIKKFIEDLKGSSIFRLNILGGNIFRYSKFQEIVSLLNNLSIFKVYYVHYRNLENKGNYLRLLNGEKNKLNILVNFPIEKNTIANVLERINTKAETTSHFIFVIENENEIECVENIVSELFIEDYSLLPYYNGDNLNFFEDAVFLSKEDILESKPNLREIFIRMAINLSDFGKISVLSDGDIYANVNAAKLGKLGKNSIYEVIYKEMMIGKSWRRLRTKVDPCKCCTFELLCPHLSNYEYAIGKNNLCHVWKNPNANSSDVVQDSIQ